MKQVNKYIALLDILGYKELIMNNEASRIEGLIMNFPVYVQRSLAEGKTTSTNGRAHFDVSHAVLNSIIISDTLIFWTKDDTTDNFFELVDCVQSLLTFTFNTPALFLRGAITVGEFYHSPTGYIQTDKGAIVSHPMIYGKGLVAAHEIEKKLDFAGCLIDEEAIRTAKNENSEVFENRWSAAIEINKIINYAVPLKGSILDNQWVINWVSNASNPTRIKIEESFANYNRTVDSPEVQAKIGNTISFYDHVKMKTERATSPEKNNQA